jgi:cytochrome b subunit of formate dehydrogenase
MTIENTASEVNKANLWLRRLARASAWVLLVGIVVLIISGWGITQTGIIYSLTGGLVDRRVADAIHRAANVPLVFFFLLHVLINIRLMVSRNHLSRGWITDGILIVIGVCFMAITIYMEYFRLGV